MNNLKFYRIIVIYLYNGCLYTNVPENFNDIKFDFDILRFKYYGCPLNSEIEKRIDDTAVIFYSSAIDKTLSNRNSHYSRFKDISNAFLLRKHISEINHAPEFAHISDIDVMQTNDIFRLLLFIIYVRDRFQDIENVNMPAYFEITLHAYNHQNLKHPTYEKLSSGLTNNFTDQLKLKILQRIFATNSIPDTWDDNTSFSEVLSSLNSQYDYNIFDSLLELFDKGGINYKQPLQRVSIGDNSPLTFGVRIDLIDYKF